MKTKTRSKKADPVFKSIKEMVDSRVVKKLRPGSDPIILVILQNPYTIYPPDQYTVRSRLEEVYGREWAVSRLRDYPGGGVVFRVTHVQKARR